MTNTTTRPINAWKTYSLFYDGQSRVPALERQHIHIEPTALIMASKIEYWDKMEGNSIDFALVAPEDIGIHRWTSMREFFKQANREAFGYQYCYPEHALYVREQYLDQPTGERIVVAMHELSLGDSQDMVFTLENKNGILILGAEYCHIKKLIRHDQKCMFIRKISTHTS